MTNFRFFMKNVAIIIACFTVVMLSSCGKDDKENKVPITNVLLNETTVTLEIGNTYQLVATVVPAQATNKDVTWVSSNAGVAEVDNQGRVTAKTEGTATVTVTTKEGNLTATCTVTVVKSIIAVTSVTLNESAVTLDVKSTLQLTATIAPADASIKDITWTSDKTDVAEVSNEGLITAKEIGKATITATASGNITATCVVTVIPEMILVQGGTFTVGNLAPDWVQNAYGTYQATLNSFYIGKYEVTQAQWVAIMDDNPSAYGPPLDRPIDNVSQDEVLEFINRLNQLTGKQYRLPTETEWEFAARGGNESQNYAYSGSNTLNDVAWFGDPAGGTHPVGGKQPNELGIYDMSGNVFERCSDWYGNYPTTPQTNPTGPASGTDHVQRGGSFYHDVDFIFNVSVRTALPDAKDAVVGFRLAHPAP